MQDLVKTIHSQDNDNTMEQDVEGFAKDLCEECLKILKEPEKSQAIPATKVFGALLSTTSASVGQPR
jgi:DNA repair/transcription protein MET18/MMS19